MDVHARSGRRGVAVLAGVTVLAVMVTVVGLSPAVRSYRFAATVREEYGSRLPIGRAELASQRYAGHQLIESNLRIAPVHRYSFVDCGISHEESGFTATIIERCQLNTIDLYPAATSSAIRSLPPGPRGELGRPLDPPLSNPSPCGRLRGGVVDSPPRPGEVLVGLTQDVAACRDAERIRSWGRVTSLRTATFDEDLNEMPAGGTWLVVIRWQHLLSTTVPCVQLITWSCADPAVTMSPVP